MHFGNQSLGSFFSILRIFNLTPCSGFFSCTATPPPCVSSWGAFFLVGFRTVSLFSHQNQKPILFQFVSASAPGGYANAIGIKAVLSISSFLLSSHFEARPLCTCHFQITSFPALEISFRICARASPFGSALFSYFRHSHRFLCLRLSLSSFRSISTALISPSRAVRAFPGFSDFCFSW